MRDFFFSLFRNNDFYVSYCNFFLVSPRDRTNTDEKFFFSQKIRLLKSCRSELWLGLVCRGIQRWPSTRAQVYYVDNLHSNTEQSIEFSRFKLENSIIRDDRKSDLHEEELLMICNTKYLRRGRKVKNSITAQTTR